MLIRSHVATTDVIKDLVITEEGSVAKGIRRLVAVTGHDAYEVQRKGKEFDAKLESIRGLQGKDKEAAMKPFLTVGTISIIETICLLDRNLVKVISLSSRRISSRSLSKRSSASCRLSPRLRPLLIRKW